MKYEYWGVKLTDFYSATNHQVISK